MKVIVINQKVAFARHWLRWYRVQRAGEDWRPLAIGQRYEKPKSVSQIAAELNKKFGKKPLPSILDEQAADQEVDRVLKKEGKAKS